MTTVVVVEDNTDNMKLFRALLHRHDYGVLEFQTGVGLVAALEQQDHPALVLLDLQLPDRDGFEVLADLRQRWGTELRVVALTAHAMAADRDRVKQAGFDGMITKPIDITRFPTLIARAIAGDGVDD